LTELNKIQEMTEHILKKLDLEGDPQFQMEYEEHIEKERIKQK